VKSSAAQYPDLDILPPMATAEISSHFSDYSGILST